jgi:hypothetical protein
LPANALGAPAAVAVLVFLCVQTVWINLRLSLQTEVGGEEEESDDEQGAAMWVQLCQQLRLDQVYAGEFGLEGTERVR